MIAVEKEGDYEESKRNYRKHGGQIMKTNYIGIDYSLRKANVDNENGIHYGVISIHEVTQTWCDSSEAIYPDEVFCPNCGQEIELISEGKSKQLPDNQGVEVEDDLYHCKNCNEDIYASDINIEMDPISFIYEKEGYSCSQTADDTDIFILKSPYYTYCQYCSPCAPGAGYIMNTVEDGIKAYCFGPDWFEGEKTPYPVYDVKTGKLIKA